MVYCEECEFLWKYRHNPRIPYPPASMIKPRCNHLSNVKIRKSALALRYEGIATPEDKNKENDCEWFVKKRGMLAELFGRWHKEDIRSVKGCLKDWPKPPVKRPPSKP